MKIPLPQIKIESSGLFPFDQRAVTSFSCFTIDDRHLLPVGLVCYLIEKFVSANQAETYCLGKKKVLSNPKKYDPAFFFVKGKSGRIFKIYSLVNRKTI